MDEPQPARELYSGLHFLLEERGMTAADLSLRARALGEPVDARTLTRLAAPDHPLKQVDSRVVDVVCRALDIDLGGLLVFSQPLAPLLQDMPADRQRRLTELMERHTEGRLPPDELAELRALVEEAGRIEIDNLRQLVAHRERLREAVATRQRSAAD